MSAYIINPAGASWVPYNIGSGYSSDFGTIVFSNYFINKGADYFEIVGYNEATPDPFDPLKVNYLLRLDNTANIFGTPPVGRSVGLIGVNGGVSQITLDTLKVEFDTPFGLPGSIFIQLFFNTPPAAGIAFSLHLFFPTA